MSCSKGELREAPPPCSPHFGGHEGLRTGGTAALVTLDGTLNDKSDPRGCRSSLESRPAPYQAPAPASLVFPGSSRAVPSISGVTNTRDERSPPPEQSRHGGGLNSVGFANQELGDGAFPCHCSLL